MCKMVGDCTYRPKMVTYNSSSPSSLVPTHESLGMRLDGLLLLSLETAQKEESVEESKTL